MTLKNFIKNSRASKIKILPKTLFSHIVEVVFIAISAHTYQKKKKNSVTKLCSGPLMPTLCILINGCLWPGAPNIALLALFVVGWNSINWNFLLFLEKMWNGVFITIGTWFLFTVIWKKFHISDRAAASSKVQDVINTWLSDAFKAFQKTYVWYVLFSFIWRKMLILQNFLLCCGGKNKVTLKSTNQLLIK